MNKCISKNDGGIYKSCADVMRTLCFYHAKSHHLDRADILVLYSTCKWFLCLAHTLFKFVIRASSHVLSVLGRCCRHFSFYTGWKTLNHSENDRGSRFAVNIRHCLRSFSLFYFVSRPIGFGKYILYRKGGTPNEWTGKTQGNRTAHHAPAQGKTHPA